MKEKKDLIAKPWAKISKEWKATVTPPLSPSPDDLKIYKKWIDEIYLNRKNKKEFNVFVLGSTREIRSLFKKYKDANIIVCDINKDHYLAMTKIMNFIPKNEIFLESEWSVAPIKKNYFDIIIGDGIISNVTHGSEDRFMLNMSGALKKEGIMIIREACIYKERSVDIEDMLYFFSKYRITKWSPIELLICLEWSVYNKKTGKVSLPNVVRQLKKRYYDEKTKKYKYSLSKDVETLLNHPNLHKWLSINKEWDVYCYQETEALIKKYYKVVMKEHGLDHMSHPVCGIFGDVTPIWILSANK